MKSFSDLNYNRLVIIAYRLPFKFVKKGKSFKAVQNAGGLVSAILALSEKMDIISENKKKILWIGSGQGTEQHNMADSRVELSHVSIPDTLNEKYYGGFCNDTIWPLFHYFSSLTVYEESYYQAYQDANRLFFEQVKKVIQPGDFVWVHDYQLFLLPEMIRKNFPEANIGFFLHIPFPSYELFRLLPRKWRESILKGIIGANLIGFHTNDYTQYFIKSVKRTLGYECLHNHIYTEDRIVKADAFPIGIDYDKFYYSCSSPSIVKEKKKLKSYLGDQKLIFSVDRLDYTKGLLNRLIAYEFFLENYPKWHKKVVFNMVVLPSRDHIEQYKDMKKEIEATVGRINGRYSNLAWRPITYQYKSLNFSELVACYAISDVGLITPLRDGMNLVAKEYIASQKENCGMLVLSEMTGAASELTEAIIISPTDMEETGDAIYKALEMPQKEKAKRIYKMQERLQNYDVFTWANDFFNQADEIKSEQIEMSVRYIDQKVIKEMKDQYHRTESRIIFIDYDGTLIPFSKYPEQAVINEKAENIIMRLSNDERNRIVIISGRDQAFLERQFTKANVTLIAEHGFFIKEPNKDWITNISIELAWKQKVTPLLDEYVDRCTGSFIEEKYASLAWHFRNVDEEFAELRINELKDDLHEILKNESKLEVLEGNKVLEIKSMLYNKGSVAAELLCKHPYTFTLAIGDDKTDEDLFKAMPDNAFTIKVGTSLSIAKYNLKKQKQLYDLFLEMMG
jgi:trehalose 6-phosphate synthase/phosphatase